MIYHMRNSHFELCKDCGKPTDGDFCVKCEFERICPKGSVRRLLWDKWTRMLKGKGIFGCDGCGHRKISTHLYGFGEHTWYLCDICHEKYRFDMIQQGLMKRTDPFSWNQWEPDWVPPVVEQGQELKQGRLFD